MTWTVTIPITPAGSRKQTAAHDVTCSGYSAEPATAERLDKATHIRKLGRRRWDRRRKLCPAEPTELCPAEQNAVTLQDTSTKGPPQTDTQSPRRHTYMTRVGGCETRKSPSSNRISANLRPQDCVLVRRAFGPTACQILSHCTPQARSGQKHTNQLRLND